MGKVNFIFVEFKLCNLTLINSFDVKFSCVMSFEER